MTDLSHYQNRLAKNARHLRKWALRNDVHAYRLYDCDIPEFPLVLDIYEAEPADAVPQTWLQLQEVDTGWQQTAFEHREWLDLVVAATAATMAIQPNRIVVKLRAAHRPRASSSGEKAAQFRASTIDGHDLIIREGGHRFLVNLESHLDTGLFLDHRNARSMIGARASGKRFLNLFGYTGSFTVYAARGRENGGGEKGAAASTTVDLSNTYCDWAEKNLALNGVDRNVHRVVREDVFAWLEHRSARAPDEAHDQFDLIVLDPPSFSNSKKMTGVLDVQRDHPWLIRRCLALLPKNGELFFSTNLRSFEMDETLRAEARFFEISRKTVPEDFRDSRIHRSWLVGR